MDLEINDAYSYFKEEKVYASHTLAYMAVLKKLGIEVFMLKVT